MNFTHGRLLIATKRVSGSVTRDKMPRARAYSAYMHLCLHCLYPVIGYLFKRTSWVVGSAERRIRRPLALGHRPSGVVAQGLVAKESERQVDAGRNICL